MPPLYCDPNRPELNDPVVWADKDPTNTEDDENGCQLIRLSEPTETPLKEAFAKAVPN